MLSSHISRLLDIKTVLFKEKPRLALSYQKCDKGKTQNDLAQL